VATGTTAAIDEVTVVDTPVVVGRFTSRVFGVVDRSSTIGRTSGGDPGTIAETVAAKAPTARPAAPIMTVADSGRTGRW